MEWQRFRLGLVLWTSFVLCVTGRCAWAKPVVLFDEAHAQRFLAREHGPLDLSALAALFARRGWEVRTGRAPFSTAAVAKVDAIVISGAFSPFTPGESDAIIRFLEGGGRLCVMLHIGAPVDQLLHHLNVAISTGVIHAREDLIEGDPLNFRVTQLEPHPLTRNVEGFNIYGGWALHNLADNVEVIARTNPTAWIDLNGDRVLSNGDAVQSFAVVLAGRRGRGRFAVFGDDAIFQNQFLVGGNLALATNLVTWLRAAEAQAAGATGAGVASR